MYLSFEVVFLALTYFTEEHIAEESSSEDERVEIRIKRKDREYSEGEWSSDSQADSNTSAEERCKIEVRLAGQRTPMDELHL